MTAKQAQDLGYETGYLVAQEMELDSDSMHPALLDALVETAVDIEKAERPHVSLELSPENLEHYDKGVTLGARDALVARTEPSNVHEPHDVP